MQKRSEHRKPPTIHWPWNSERNTNSCAKRIYWVLMKSQYALIYAIYIGLHPLPHNRSHVGLANGWILDPHFFPPSPLPCTKQPSLDYHICEKQQTQASKAELRTRQEEHYLVSIMTLTSLSLYFSRTAFVLSLPYSSTEGRCPVEFGRTSPLTWPKIRHCRRLLCSPGRCCRCKSNH